MRKRRRHLRRDMRMSIRTRTDFVINILSHFKCATAGCLFQNGVNSGVTPEKKNQIGNSNQMNKHFSLNHVHKVSQMEHVRSNRNGAIAINGTNNLPQNSTRSRKIRGVPKMIKNDININIQIRAFSGV